VGSDILAMVGENRRIGPNPWIASGSPDVRGVSMWDWDYLREKCPFGARRSVGLKISSKEFSFDIFKNVSWQTVVKEK